jgi:hypothetical protein
MHPLLRASADRNFGLFTAADARRAGYASPEIRHLLSSGQWVRMRRGIYFARSDLDAVTSPAQHHRIECLALLMQLDRPSAVISHSSAARLWGLPLRRGMGNGLRLTDPTGWRRGKDFVMAQAPIDDWETAHDGPVRLTSAGRTLVDCAREWDLEPSVIALDAALLLEITSRQALDRTLARCSHWPGAPRARRAVSLADGRAESPLETKGRLRLVGAGLAPDQLQVEIHSAGRFVGVVDAWYEQAAVALEFDGRVKYTDPWRGRTPRQVLWEEKRREDELRALDIRVVRIADVDVGPAWPAVEQRLHRLVRQPGPQRRRFVAIPRARGRVQSA